MAIDCYTALDWLLPKGEKFPRSYRFTLTHRIMGAALDLQDALIKAEVSRGRQRYIDLCTADAHLSRLRVYLRLVHKWHWLSHGQYEHVSKMLLEIGRLLGGWIKSSGR